MQQLMNNPTLHLDVDRVRAQQVGLTQRDVAQNLLVSLSSSFQTAPTFWVNPKNGVSYNLAVHVAAVSKWTRCEALMNTPISGAKYSIAASAGEPGDGHARNHAGGRQPLQRGPYGRCFRQRGWPRSGWRGRRHRRRS